MMVEKSGFEMVSFLLGVIFGVIFQDFFSVFWGDFEMDLSEVDGTLDILKQHHFHCPSVGVNQP